MPACVRSAVPARCARFMVPEDPADPTGRQIGLWVMVIPARSATPASDPVFLLAGGPGGAATESFDWAPGTFRDILGHRDMVMVDQRGTGGSNQMVVPPDPNLAGLDAGARAAALGAWYDAALDSMPGDPRFYTTSIAMDDLDMVRDALGYDQINLYGPSYGATAAQYYLRQHPDHVRSVVLDGGTLLDVPIFERIAANSQRALDLVFDRCEADPSCQDAFPEVRAEFAATMQALTEAGSVTTTILGANGEPAVIDPMVFAGAIQSALLDVTLSSQLPAFIHIAAQGDWDAAVSMAQAATGGGTGESNRLAMADVIRCSEAWARWDPEEVARTGAGSFNLEAQLDGARFQAELCRHVPSGVVPANDGEPVRSDVPVLIVVGEADPQDPPANTMDAATELPNSRTVIVPGMGHTVGHLGCMPSVVADFIEAGRADGLDTNCVPGDVPLPTFRIH